MLRKYRARLLAAFLASYPWCRSLGHRLAKPLRESMYRSHFSADSNTILLACTT
jgi:hypothetical protein